MFPGHTVGVAVKGEAGHSSFQTGLASLQVSNYTVTDRNLKNLSSGGDE